MNAIATPLDYFIGMYLVKIFLLLIGQAIRLCFPLAGQICVFYAGIFDH
jgi:hypothetical protein